MSSIDQQGLSWRRSFACANGECVEVAYWDDLVFVRNSRASDVILEVRRSQWERFLADVMIGGSSLSSLGRMGTESSEDAPQGPG